jgi:hypothetical protein
MADFGFGYDSSGDSSDGYSGSELAGNLIGAGTSLLNTAILANANPTNVALLQGQSISTPTLQTTGSSMAGASISGMGLLFLVGAGVVLFFLVRG